MSQMTVAEFKKKFANIDDSGELLFYANMWLGTSKAQVLTSLESMKIGAQTVLEMFEIEGTVTDDDAIALIDAFNDMLEAYSEEDAWNAAGEKLIEIFCPEA